MYKLKNRSSILHFSNKYLLFLFFNFSLLYTMLKESEQNHFFVEYFEHYQFVRGFRNRDFLSLSNVPIGNSSDETIRILTDLNLKKKEINFSTFTILTYINKL